MLYDKAKHRYDRACDEQRKHALHHSCIIAVYGQAAVDAALTEDAIAASNSTENKKRKTAFSALYEKAALHLINPERASSTRHAAFTSSNSRPYI